MEEKTQKQEMQIKELHSAIKRYQNETSEHHNKELLLKQKVIKLEQELQGSHQLQ